MLARLLKPRRPLIAGAAIPHGQRVYAVGDIHGRLDLLDPLIARIDADGADRTKADTTIVFLGDLIDRGPDSAGVVECLRTLGVVRSDFRFLMGNHEEVFLSALNGDERALRLFCRIGGRETILSYGIDEMAYERMDYAELGTALTSVVPRSHQDFISAFEDRLIIGDYAFVHAGVRGDLTVEDQVTTDLRWIREPFLRGHGNYDKRIVHGHTISDIVEFRPHRIGIDTGAYATGTLTALGLEGAESWLLQT